VLGPAPGLDTFLWATGFSGHGFAMAPLVGRLLAEWVVDGKPSRDVRSMRYSRFAEGDLRVPGNLI
jgi:glycine/D-amino acid oxidase-like deaminating enzyme